MKKLLITIIVAVFTLQLSAQTTAYSVVEFRAKPHTQKDLLNIFNRTFDSVAMNQGGVLHWSESEMEEPTEQPTVWYGFGPWVKI